VPLVKNFSVFICEPYWTKVNLSGACLNVDAKSAILHFKVLATHSIWCFTQSFWYTECRASYV